jgi:cardiolipin synthase
MRTVSELGGPEWAPFGSPPGPGAEVPAPSPAAPAARLEEVQARPVTVVGPVAEWPRRDVTRPPKALNFQPNTGIRPPPGYWAQKAIAVGLRAPETTVATRAALWALEQGRLGAAGAPLRALDLAPTPNGLPATLEALKGRFRRPELLDRIFTSSPSAFVAELDRALGQRQEGLEDVRSLRELVAQAFSAGPARASALRALDAHLAQARRHPHEPLHDLITDPTGLRGPAVDGRIPNVIDKVLSIRRLGRMSKADLASYHEVTSNNQARVLAGGRTAYPAILKAIRGARSSVHVSYFILKDDQCGQDLVAALIARARAGVKVRVQLDEVGGILGGHHPGKLLRQLRAGGVEVVCNRIVDTDRQMRPLNRPDHRKQVIVDGKLAFTGGLNIGDAYVHDWHDVVVAVEGDVVHQLQADWMLNWMALHGELDPGVGDDAFRQRYFPPQAKLGPCRLKLAQTIPGEHLEIQRGLLDMIAGARHSILIATPYITSIEVQDALLRAAQRGVWIRLVLPGENNHKSCELAAWPALKALTEAGVEVYLYPGMSHGKVMVVDETLTSVGTANLDDLSLVANYELNLHSDDPALARQMIQRVFAPDIARSRLVASDEISAAQVAAGRAMRVFTPFL